MVARIVLENCHGQEKRLIYISKIFNEYQVPRDNALREYCKLHGILLFEIDGRKYTGEKIRKYILENIVCKLPS